MIPHPIRLPNGHLSHSLKITRLRVMMERSPDPRMPYVEIWEGNSLVYEGPVDLASLSREAPRPRLRVIEGGLGDLPAQASRRARVSGPRPRLLSCGP